MILIAFFVWDIVPTPTASMTSVGAIITSEGNTSQCEADIKAKYSMPPDIGIVLAYEDGWPASCARVKYTYEGQTHEDMPMFATNPVGTTVDAMVFKHRPHIPIPMRKLDANGNVVTVALSGTDGPGGSSTTGPMGSTVGPSSSNNNKKMLGPILIGGGVFIAVIAIVGVLLLVLMNRGRGRGGGRR